MMIDVKEAEKIVLRHPQSPRTEERPLAKALGGVLSEGIGADRDFPPYDRVTMDGIALCHAAVKEGRTSFPSEGTAAAGQPRALLQNPHACLEAMTGAVLPENTDTVIPYEHIERKGNAICLKIPGSEVARGQNVHGQGSDRRKGDLILPAGCLLEAPQIAVAATVGASAVRLRQLSPVLVVSTGDELVEIDQKPLPHQIRKSNTYALRAVLRTLHTESAALHLPDRATEIKESLGRALQDYRTVILSGGVSKGKFDHLPAALESLGVRKLFHGVAQRPGKPFWFGISPGGTTVFAFPGNPVSAFLCMHRYFVPWLRRSLGLPDAVRRRVILAEDVHFTPKLSYFLPVKTEEGEDGRLRARPLPGHGSGDLANLVDACGFAELFSGKNVYQKGESYPFIPYMFS